VEQWAIARYDLGLSDADFRLMTLRQFIGLYDRHLERRNHEDMRFGILCATAANFSMGKDPDKPPLRPQDFFPWLPEPEEEPEAMDGDQMMAFIQSFRAQRGKPN